MYRVLRIRWYLKYLKYLSSYPQYFVEFPLIAFGLLVPVLLLCSRARRVRKPLCLISLSSTNRVIQVMNGPKLPWDLEQRSSSGPSMRAPCSPRWANTRRGPVVGAPPRAPWPAREPQWSRCIPTRRVRRTEYGVQHVGMYEDRPSGQGCGPRRRPIASSARYQLPIPAGWALHDLYCFSRLNPLRPRGPPSRLAPFLSNHQNPFFSKAGKANLA